MTSTSSPARAERASPSSSPSRSRRSGCSGSLTSWPEPARANHRLGQLTPRPPLPGLGDDGAEVGLLVERGLEQLGEDAQLAWRDAPDRLGLRERVPRAREAEEARAAALAVRGEHRADAAAAVRIGAGDDRVGRDAFEH